MSGSSTTPFVPRAASSLPTAIAARRAATTITSSRPMAVLRPALVNV